MKILLVSITLLFATSIQAQTVVFEIFTDPNYRGALLEGHRHDNFLELSRQWNNSFSSLEVFEGHVILYDKFKHTGRCWIASANGGPGRDGYYPNLNGYGADRISSIKWTPLVSDYQRSLCESRRWHDPNG